MTLEDILNEYVAASGEQPNVNLLEIWAKRYPKYEEELRVFTFYWTLMEIAVSEKEEE